MSAHEFKLIAQDLNARPETLALAIFTWVAEHHRVHESFIYLDTTDDDLMDVARKGLKHLPDEHYRILIDLAHDQKKTIFEIVTAVLLWFAGKRMHQQVSMDAWLQDAMRLSGATELPTTFTLICEKCEKAFEGSRGKKFCSNECAYADAQETQKKREYAGIPRGAFY